MKVLAAFIALAVASAHAQFAQELATFHNNFDQEHLNIDMWLREQRILVSESIREANQVALDHVWTDVQAILFITAAAQYDIDYHVENSGENACTTQIRERLAALEDDAADRISACSRNLHRDFNHALNYGFFDHINYAQRMSHFLQVLVMYTLGHYNAVTNQEYIRAELQYNWDHVDNVRDETYINYYRNILEVGKGTGNLNVNNCLQVILNLYNNDVTSLRNDLNQC